MNAPLVTRTPDGAILLETASIDHWSAFVTVLADNPSLRLHLMRACRRGDGRLKAYTAFRLSEACETAMQTVLTDTQAENLAEQLDAARQEPDECQFCNRAAVVEVEGVPMCSVHAAARDACEPVTL